jgi:hypothetical protein
MAMSYRPIYQLVALAASISSAVSTAFAGANPNFTLPLHAKVSYFEPCDGYLPVDCLDVRPTIQVETGQTVTVFLLVANHTQLGGVQTAFEVDPSWIFIYGLWECAPGLYPTAPSPPFGPTSGSIGRAFDCVTRGGLVPVGRLVFSAGTGCVSQIESSFPNGIHLLDCEQQIDRILPDEPGQRARLGRVCVGPGGNDACGVATSVAAATWGRIKATYPEGRW